MWLKCVTWLWVSVWWLIQKGTSRPSQAYRHQSQTIFIIAKLLKMCSVTSGLGLSPIGLKRVPRFWVSVRWLVCGIRCGGAAGWCLGATGT